MQLIIISQKKWNSQGFLFHFSVVLFSRRVEELGTGAAYCQLLDILFPGQIPISRVKFDPKQESDCLDNFKIICSTFTKLDIDKSVDVDRLVSLKFQDNLIFLHWFKKFFDKEFKGRETNMTQWEHDKAPLLAREALGARSGAPVGGPTIIGEMLEPAAVGQQTPS